LLRSGFQIINISFKAQNFGNIYSGYSGFGGYILFRNIPDRNIPPPLQLTSWMAQKKQKRNLKKNHKHLSVGTDGGVTLYKFTKVAALQATDEAEASPEQCIKCLPSAREGSRSRVRGPVEMTYVNVYIRFMGEMPWPYLGLDILQHKRKLETL
jgi:hypothetical protein